MVTTCYPRFEGDSAGVFVQSLAKGLVEHGLEVSVVTPHDAGVPAHEEMDGVSVHRFVYALPTRLQCVAYQAGIPDNLVVNSLAKLEVPLFALAGLAKVTSVAASADVIHAHWTLSGVFAAGAVAAWRKPMLLTLLGDGIRGLPVLANRIALRAADAVVCTTAEMAEHLAPYRYPGPVLDIKHFPNLSRLDAPRDLDSELADWCEKGSSVVTMVARMVADKDPVGFVRAVPNVLAEHPGARFLVVGEGPELPKVAAAVRELGIERSTCLAGARNDVGAILRASTVFVANSPLTNCYSTTIQEAMTVGVPIVATDVGDPDGSYRRKDYVELVRPRDPRDLARGINVLLADEALRSHRIGMGRQFLADLGFEPDLVIRQTIRAYRNILARRRRNKPRRKELLT